jgi:hypothetical protein
MTISSSGESVPFPESSVVAVGRRHAVGLDGCSRMLS